MVVDLLTRYSERLRNPALQMQGAYLESPGLQDFNEIEPGPLAGQCSLLNFPCVATVLALYLPS